MSQTVLIATAPVGTDDDSAERHRLDADFDARWAAWQTRGRIHDRAVRRKLLMLAPAAVIAAAIVCLLLIRLSGFFRQLWHTKAPSPDKPFRDELLSIERLEERALAPAASFTIDPSPRRRAPYQ